MLRIAYLLTSPPHEVSVHRGGLLGQFWFSSQGQPTSGPDEHSFTLLAPPQSAQSSFGSFWHTSLSSSPPSGSSEGGCIAAIAAVAPNCSVTLQSAAVCAQETQAKGRNKNGLSHTHKEEASHSVGVVLKLWIGDSLIKKNLLSPTSNRVFYKPPVYGRISRRTGRPSILVMSSSNSFSRVAFTFSSAAFFLPILGQWFLANANKRSRNF